MLRENQRTRKNERPSIHLTCLVLFTDVMVVISGNAIRRPILVAHDMTWGKRQNIVEATAPAPYGVRIVTTFCYSKS